MLSDIQGGPEWQAAHWNPPERWLHGPPPMGELPPQRRSWTSAGSWPAARPLTCAQGARWRRGCARACQKLPGGQCRSRRGARATMGRSAGHLWREAPVSAEAHLHLGGAEHCHSRHCGNAGVDSAVLADPSLWEVSAWLGARLRRPQQDPAQSQALCSALQGATSTRVQLVSFVQRAKGGQLYWPSSQPSSTQSEKRHTEKR